MRIIGPENLLFGVDAIEPCRTYLTDYGLHEIDLGDDRYRFEALDGTAVTICRRDDPKLPPPLPTATMLRQTVWGCEDQAAVDAIAEELAKDRPVDRLPDGSIATVDAVGFQIAFRATERRKLELLAEKVNSPGAAPGRALNELGADEIFEARPRTLSHVVYFTPDSHAMEAFYAERLGFRVIDRFRNLGPFMQPQANDDHHCLFMLNTPPYMQGLEHLAFHLQGPTALMLAGSRMAKKGYESFWGPGRHQFGSNWFWYFNSPLATHFEYDADMDKHGGDWLPLNVYVGPETSQIFLFEHVEKWHPGGGPKESHDTSG